MNEHHKPVFDIYIYEDNDFVAALHARPDAKGDGGTITASTVEDASPALLASNLCSLGYALLLEQGLISENQYNLEIMFQKLLSDPQPEEPPSPTDPPPWWDGEVS